jgi:UDPglucose--hexose-1-phosphate uridylyltransferase
MSAGPAPHRRLNRLSGEWVIVSPQRTQRPWQGQVEAVAPERRPAYDPACYLCPGNERAGGARTPAYTSTYVFDNDFAALLPDAPAEPAEPPASSGLLVREPERGVCRVVCFSPRHDLTLGEMDPGAIERVVDTWA